MAKDEKQSDKKDMEPAKGGIVPGSDGKPQLVMAGGEGQTAGGGTQQGSNGTAGEKPPAEGGVVPGAEKEDEAAAIRKIGAALAHLDRIHAPGVIMDGLLAIVVRGLAGLDYECSPEQAARALPTLLALAEAAGRAEPAEHIAAAIKALE